MHDVIICDEEYQTAAGAITAALNKLDRLFADYTKELETISRNGVIEGNRGKALNAYAREAETVRAAIQKIAEGHAKASRAFLLDIDTADRELF
ncbi:MAG: hypothetical protein IKO25_01940 [Clostridia bacterium]|nr:hypothetical protein [Clostridia bacterium]